MQDKSLVALAETLKRVESIYQQLEDDLAYMVCFLPCLDDVGMAVNYLMPLRLVMNEARKLLQKNPAMEESGPDTYDDKEYKKNLRFVHWGDHTKDYDYINDKKRDLT